jgi:hypothetical protein
MVSTKTNQPLLLVMVAMATASACAQVEADVPEAQVTQKGVSFHGTGYSGWSSEVSTTQTFTLDKSNLSWVKDLNSKIYLTQIDLRATGTVQDLSFIHYAHVTMSDGDKLAMPVEVVDYKRPDNQGATSLITSKTDYPVDVSKLWTAKKIVVTVSVAGDLPDKSWAVDVILHLSGKISYKL